MTSEGYVQQRNTRLQEARAISSIVGVLVLLVLTVCLTTVVAIALGTWSLGAPQPTARFELAADSADSSITIEHTAGDAIDVETLSVTITVNGTPLSDQPPVPFVGASGFEGTPDGPFNARADPKWTAGEQAGVSVAETNTPALAAGDAVSVTLAVDGQRVAELETTAV
ncbi:type IV pilin N-terminal domain-containing protein [Natrinema salaciae]|uniref:Archaeal Type IV pilin N-terminal domain-containing protein n=1 Tax=Natrinema salaciae TaxID=1186196 RepID=A0A1H9MNR3_9EURY|nr:type IV pilin N-terminal domain-containing protein [Natrinema salaciae]SER25278.1 Protein of unknown function [Natrinema salaciae]